MSNTIRVVDLFCGCGGLSKGFRNAGIDVLRGFDNWPIAIETYSENLPEGAELLDLSDVDSTIVRLSPWMKQANGIIGGPPCQDFSSAGKRVEGTRADLTEKYASVVINFMPEFFLMENVPRAQKASAFRRAIQEMSNAGYGITEQVINSMYCGVPQNRKRLITVGFRDANHDDSFRSFLLDGLSDKPMSLRDYFGDALDTDYIYRHPRSYARRAVFSVDDPSPTIRGVNRPIPNGYPGHPGDAAPAYMSRPLTTDERARVQTFEDYVWLGSKTDNEQMIGNAVPVKLGEHVAKAIERYLESVGFIETPPEALS